MRLKGEYFKQLSEALLDAFSKPAGLKSIVRYGLDVNLEEIVTQQGTYREQVEDLIRWAEDGDQVEVLIACAREENRTNKQLEMIEEKIFSSGKDAYVIPTKEFASVEEKNKFSAFERSRMLSDIYYKVKPGRQSMEAIYRKWPSAAGKKASELSGIEREVFKSYYNEEFHRSLPGTPNKKLSDAIHTYLHELNSLWQRVMSQEFTRDEAMEMMGTGIYMDRYLIMLFLEAHWEAHPDHSFWKKVPDIVNEAEKWQAKRATTFEALSANDVVDPKERMAEVGTMVDTYEDAKTGLEMIPIPAGFFEYQDDERREYLGDYWISKRPITNDDYLRYLREKEQEGEELQPPGGWGGKSPKSDKANHPVTHVTWNDAKAYAKWAGMSLPSEKEWEKAARGTDGFIYPWGNEWHDGYCNTVEAGIGGTTPVGHYPEGDSPYGCNDMAGNVWEWTADLGDGQPVAKGGSWTSTKVDSRTAYRNNTFTLQTLDSHLGFRVVRRSLSL